MKKAKSMMGSSTVAASSFFKSDESELTILKVLISFNHESKSGSSITGDFNSSPCIFGIKLMNAGATDQDSILSIKTGTRLFLCDILGQGFWNTLSNKQRIGVGLCVLKLIAENLLQVEFPANGYDDSVASAKSKKVSRNR